MIDIIKSRRSIRAYKSQPVAKEILTDIVDCGRLAPSGYNHQPWIFVVVTDPDVRKQIAAATRYAWFIQYAGACIAVFCKVGIETMFEDACAATENMIIAAQAYGLGTCWINVHQKAHSAAMKQIFNCPAEYELMTLFAVGYPDEEKQTAKKTFAEVLRWNSF